MINCKICGSNSQGWCRCGDHSTEQSDHERSMDSLLIVSEVAKILRVSSEYVREMIRQKKIKAYKEGRRGGYRIRKDEIQLYIYRKEKEYKKERK